MKHYIIILAVVFCGLAYVGYLHFKKSDEVIPGVTGDVGINDSQLCPDGTHRVSIPAYDDEGKLTGMGSNCLTYEQEDQLRKNIESFLEHTRGSTKSAVTVMPVSIGRGSALEGFTTQKDNEISNGKGGGSGDGGYYPKESLENDILSATSDYTTAGGGSGYYWQVNPQKLAKYLASKQ